MSVPVGQMMAVLKHVAVQRLRGNARYPLVLMLEPLFRTLPWVESAGLRACAAIPIEPDQSCLLAVSRVPREWSHVDAVALRFVADLCRDPGVASSMGRSRLEQLFRLKGRDTEV